MSLTKEDVQTIKSIIDTKIDNLSITLAKQFESIDKRFDKIDKKFEAIDERFNKIESKLTNMQKRH